MRTRILGISGLAGSGKDTVANMLKSHFTVAHLSFADPIKEFCREVFDFSYDQLYGPSASRNAPDPRHGGLTPRHALQTLGTEWGRSLDPDVWVKLGMRRALAHLEADPDSLVVFTDCRFLNEASAIRGVGGQVLFVQRSDAGLQGAAGAHKSEQEILTDDYQDLCTARINNDGPQDRLKESVYHLSLGLQ